MAKSAAPGKVAAQQFERSLPCLNPLPCTARTVFTLAAQLWRPAGAERGAVIISCATGVLSRYYARYANFLTEHGFAALTTTTFAASAGRGRSACAA